MMSQTACSPTLPTNRSPKLSLSSPPVFQLYIRALRPHTAHARSHQKNIRGPLKQGQWNILTNNTDFGGIVSYLDDYETETNLLLSQMNSIKGESSVNKLGIIFL